MARERQNMRERVYLNDEFSFNGGAKVRLPHTMTETPYNYFDESEYQKEGIYTCDITADAADKKYILTIEGAAHITEVFVNNVSVKKHMCGYTAFSVDITSKLKFGSTNKIKIKVTSDETVNVPPFGKVIDYMTYNGIYRDVYLDIVSTAYIKDVYVHPVRTGKGIYTYKSDVTVCFPKGSNRENVRITQELTPLKLHNYKHVDCDIPDNELYKADPKLSTNFTRQRKILNLNALFEDEIDKNYEGVANGFVADVIEEVKENDELISFEKLEDSEYGVLSIDSDIMGVREWDLETPYRYNCVTTLYIDDVAVDEYSVVFGFRDMRFKTDGFYLNDKKVKISGLNRHQAYPYVGYAMPRSIQRYDAELLKYELGVNAVRTSHYPQSHYFIERCDELGLLVFTEIPGWQHIGDENWKYQAKINTRDMVLQYRNHPSIMLWGVRINESQDDDEFYKDTNRIAHALDYRQTGGVRFITKSHLLEDVYTFNDFSHTGSNEGCLDKASVTPDTKKAYLISEYNGHMYPTKAFDDEDHRTEHMKRHANVLNAYMGKSDIAGGFAWCMTDYNTHKDFGSGDRICYHGVMDMFRNKKFAAAIYASQGISEPVLEISSSYDIGDHPAGYLPAAYAVTNLDSVKMYKNGTFIKEFFPNKDEYPNLLHPPIYMDDTIGNRIEDEEHFSHKKAEDVKFVLLGAAKYGMDNLPRKVKLRAAKCIIKHHMNMAQAVELYGKYVAGWGDKVTVYTFEGVKDGKVVKTVEKRPMVKPCLKVMCSRKVLKEDITYDVSAIRMNLISDSGNLLNYANVPLKLTTEGTVSIIGPQIISLNGGMGGTYVKSNGVPGMGKLIIDGQGIHEVIEFAVI